MYEHTMLFFMLLLLKDNLNSLTYFNPFITFTCAKNAECQEAPHFLCKEKYSMFLHSSGTSTNLRWMHYADRYSMRKWLIDFCFFKLLLTMVSKTSHELFIIICSP